MPIYDTPNLTTGIDEAIVDIVTTVPIFSPMLLVFIFFVVLIGGSTAQRKREGYSDMPMWSALASLSTFLIALAMTIADGVISLLTLSIVITLVIGSGLWLFLDRNRREV